MKKKTKITVSRIAATKERIRLLSTVRYLLSNDIIHDVNRVNINNLIENPTGN